MHTLGITGETDLRREPQNLVDDTSPLDLTAIR